MSNIISYGVIKLLESLGVKHAIGSPGSRNAPLLLALSKSSGINLQMVVDERNAAFIALGLAISNGEPCILTCTSGTALLNYAPAIAEAYYRKVPLIILSADRPKEWIGQDDSQTIIQTNALSNIVKKSYNISSEENIDNAWFVNRIVNDAFITSTNGRKGPVHINIQISDPTINKAWIDEAEQHDLIHILSRRINIFTSSKSVETSRIRQLGATIASPCKVMIISGFNSPNSKLNQALKKISQLPNVAILTETISNIHGEYVDCIDATLASVPQSEIENLTPDVVITLGGAIVSRHIKQFLRSGSVQAHWHVGLNEETIDCFQKLTLRIDIEPEVFFPQLASALMPYRSKCDYAEKWRKFYHRALSLTQSFCDKAPWSDLIAFKTIISKIPRRWNVHFSNGTAIRYAQLFGNHDYHRCDCNRGVSGIDGSTSTAIGASLAYKSDSTLLISGDMSAVYNFDGLLTENIPSRFKMIIIDNDGGDIFRFIKSTSNIDTDDRDRLFSCKSNGKLEELVKGIGFKSFSACNLIELSQSLKLMIAENEKPSILIVKTNGCESSEILKEYFSYIKNN